MNQEHIINVAIEIGIAAPISPRYNPKQYLKYDIGLNNSLFNCPFLIDSAISSFIPHVAMAFIEITKT